MWMNSIGIERISKNHLISKEGIPVSPRNGGLHFEATGDPELKKQKRLAPPLPRARTHFLGLVLKNKKNRGKWVLGELGPSSQFFFEKKTIRWVNLSNIRRGNISLGWTNPFYPIFARWKWKIVPKQIFGNLQTKKKLRFSGVIMLAVTKQMVTQQLFVCFLWSLFDPPIEREKKTTTFIQFHDIALSRTGCHFIMGDFMHNQG